MLYTDFRKDELFEDKQAAIESSRKKAKEAFINSIARVTISHDEYGEEFYYNTCDLSYKEISTYFTIYKKDRSTIYEVQLKELNNSDII